MPPHDLHSPTLSWPRPLALLGIAVLMAVAASLMALSMREFEFKVIGDAHWYLRFMEVVAREGPGAFPRLFDEWNADPAAWISPPPSRVGFILASAGWATLFGTSPATLGSLSLASFAVGVVVNWAFARRRFGETFALLFAALIAFSPLFLGLSRLLLTDSFTTLCLSVAVWSFLELVEAPASRRWLFVFGVSFAWVILVKELTVLLAGPLALFVLIERFARRTPLPLLRMGLALAVPPLCTLPILVLAAGSPAKLAETVRIVLTSPTTNQYAVKFCSGPWYRYLIDYLCLSPWVTVLALCALGGLVVRWRSGLYERSTAYFAILAVGLVFEHAFFIKNVRYLAILELSLRVLALWFLFELVGQSRRATLIVAGVVIVLCAIDWSTFVAFWGAGGLNDPVTPMLVALRDMLPVRW